MLPMFVSTPASVSTLQLPPISPLRPLPVAKNAELACIENQREFCEGRNTQPASALLVLVNIAVPVADPGVRTRKLLSKVDNVLMTLLPATP